MQVDYIKRKPLYSKKKIIASLCKMSNYHSISKNKDQNTVFLSNNDVLITIDRQFIDVVYLANPSRSEKKAILNMVTEAVAGC